MKQLTFLKQRSLSYIRENTKIIRQSVFTLFFIGLGIWFIRHEQTELQQVRHILFTSSWEWLLAGILLAMLYILLQGLMYTTSFAAIGSKVSLNDSTVLFLKRNFISVFLPAGGISSLAFFTGSLEKKGLVKSQIHFASSIYAFVGILSVVLVAIPSFLLALFQGNIGSEEWMALASVLVIILLIYFLYQAIRTQRFGYQKLIHYSPSVHGYIQDLESNKINGRYFALTVFYSVLIELTGVAHIYIAMVALRLEPSLFAAVMSYLVAVIFLIISPFLRGLGAIEVSMTYLLIRFGFDHAQALSITFFYRFLEFWLPLFAGAASFLLKINKLIMRVFPALLLLLLGIVNIISVLTPAINHRLHFLKSFLPLDAITVSNYFVFITGLFLLVTAAFMLKGLRMAWYFSMGLCFISAIGNITKAIDYEEAIFACGVIAVLFISKKEYYIRNSRRLGLIGIQTTLLTCFAVLIYGCIGFYYLDQKHFNINFNWGESIYYTFLNFLLIGSSELTPQDTFASDFIYSLNVSGFLCITFLMYTLIRPYILKTTVQTDDLKWAENQVLKHGRSALDYFKTYPDKLIFRSGDTESFIAYRISGNFAVALECPVGPVESMPSCIAAFDRFCAGSGLKSLYYRVPREMLDAFMGKNKLFLGQEAIVDLRQFSLEGGTKKSIRNAIKKVSEKGFHSKIYTAPIDNLLLEKVEAVSEQWLADTHRSEIVFSQGMFNSLELKNQTLLTVEDAQGNIVAFLNIIPDYSPDEATFDLIRKTADAPGGVLDFLTVELFNYLKAEGYSTVNLGFAPLSGINAPENFQERSMKFAYEKIRTFSHYKGLRDFKEKFSPVWYDKYLLFDEDYDLFKVPAALTRVIKP